MLKRSRSLENFSESKHFKSERNIIDIVQCEDIFLLELSHPICDENCWLPEDSINIASRYNKLNVAKWLHQNCKKQHKHIIALEYAKQNNNKEFINWLFE